MKIGVVICTNDAETSWNALRYANFCLGKKDEVNISFMGKGAEYQRIGTDKFNTVEEAEKFMQAGGRIYVCGSCIKSRDEEGSEMCPISTMKDMYDIVKKMIRSSHFRNTVSSMIYQDFWVTTGASGAGAR